MKLTDLTAAEFALIIRALGSLAERVTDKPTADACEKLLVRLLEAWAGKETE